MNEKLRTASVRSMTRVTLKEAIYKKCPRLSRAQTGKILDAVFEEIVLALESGENVEIRKFGRFKLRNKRERMGRNPRTGVDKVISARRVVTFYGSKELITKLSERLEAPPAPPKQTTARALIYS